MKNAIAIIVGLVLVSGAAAQKPGAEPRTTASQTSCRAFVQGFYDWYVPLALKDHKEPAWNLALKARPNAFSAQLARLLNRDSEAQRKASTTTGELVGLDFDPFLNSQDPSERFAVEAVREKGTGCWAEVRGISSGHKRERVMPEARCNDGRCQFVNFHYESDGKADDLVAILQSSRY